ncbi:hypothetical protein [Sulfobacillus thermosulfidooxidans]|uniref:hypothetical protein n=1 Tax=Sulfobacillus thermosulfidooxidans TaxID=28034 RepID=UPI000A514F43|nr:hypothetical protein [Sulfobacillus thermosulfidooxidans]
MKTLSVSLFRLDEWVPGFSEILIAVNQSLRNINRGKMDFLPYSKTIESFEWFMEALLTPQGENRPPAVGHWQIRITHCHDLPDILLQGKSRNNEERGLLVFYCPDSPWQVQALQWPETHPEE